MASRGIELARDITSSERLVALEESPLCSGSVTGWVGGTDVLRE